MNKCIQCFVNNARGKFCSKKCADKNYAERTKNKKQEYDRLRHLNNADKNIIRAKAWRDAHKSERWTKEKTILENSFEKRFYKTAMTVIKSYYRSGSVPKKSKTFERLGFTFNELTNKLISTIPYGFTWQDYISGLLHLDHIKPHSLFKYSSFLDNSFKQCWSVENLQLLEKNKNIRKQKLYEPASSGKTT